MYFVNNQEMKLIQALKKITRTHRVNAWADSNREPHVSNCPGCIAQDALRIFCHDTQISLAAYEAL